MTQTRPWHRSPRDVDRPWMSTALNSYTLAAFFGSTDMVSTVMSEFIPSVLKRLKAQTGLSSQSQHQGASAIDF